MTDWLVNPLLFHPLFVLLTAGLLFLSTIFFIAARIADHPRWVESWMMAARGTFWFGLGSALLTLLSGVLAYAILDVHGQAVREAMNRHIAFGLGSTILYLSLGFGLWRKEERESPDLPQQTPAAPWLAGLVVAAVLMAVTAYLGNGFSLSRIGDITFSDHVMGPPATLRLD
jgi:uncharacterized membrane protein